MSPQDCDICNKVQTAFGDSERPEHFTCMDGDYECMDAEKLWQSRSPETLRFEDVWGSICGPHSELLEAGWLYYFPSFVRLALENVANDSGEHLPCEHLVFFMLRPNSRLHDACNDSQKAVVAEVVDYILSNHIDANGYFTDEDAGLVRSYWR